MIFVPGKWYAVGWTNDEGTTQWDQIICYQGEGYWTDESGEQVESLFDPILQCRVAVDAADEYAQQVC